MFPQKALRAGVAMVLLLALMSISCSSVNIPFLATETPTPTLTFTPSPTPTITFTPSPTATATSTPSPTPLPSGTVIEEQSNGTLLFIDYDNGYQLMFPKDWVAIPLSSEDLASRVDALADSNPAFRDVADMFLQLDPDIIRLVAINADPKYIYNGFSTNVTITAIEDKLMSEMPMGFVTGAIEESLKNQGARLLPMEEPVITNSNGVEIGRFDFLKRTPTPTGANLEVRAITFLFQVNDKVIMVQLTTPKQFGDELLPGLEDISDSIKLLK